METARILQFRHETSEDFPGLDFSPLEGNVEVRDRGGQVSITKWPESYGPIPTKQQFVEWERSEKYASWKESSAEARQVDALTQSELARALVKTLADFDRSATPKTEENITEMLKSAVRELAKDLPDMGNV